VHTEVQCDSIDMQALDDRKQLRDFDATMHRTLETRGGPECDRRECLYDPVHLRKPAERSKACNPATDLRHYREFGGHRTVYER